jgi:hypothetical protein
LSLTITGFRIDITTASRQRELHLPHPTSNVSKPPNLFIASMLAWSSNMGVRYCFDQCVLLDVFDSPAKYSYCLMFRDVTHHTTPTNLQPHLATWRSNKHPRRYDTAILR